MAVGVRVILDSHPHPLTIIYAHNLLNHALEKLECLGGTMSQRLVSTEHLFKNKEQV